MISKLILKNFQSHEKSILSFSTGLNCIVGPSRSGKTALLRALRLCCQNRPTGDAFRSSWGGITRVSVLTSDNTKVSRIKSKKVNQYAVTIQDQRHVLDAVGKGEPPDIVLKALNLNEVNWQSQHQGVFMLADSPGQVARTLNSLTQLDLMTKVMGKIASDLRTVTGQSVANEESIKILENKLEPFAGLKSLLESGKDHEKKELLLDQKKTLLEKLESLSNSLTKSDRIIKGFTGLQIYHPQIEELNTASCRISSLKDVLSKLVKLQDRWLTFNTLYMDLKKEHQTQSEELIKNMPKVCPLCGKE